jgi:hypothetical protein
MYLNGEGAGRNEKETWRWINEHRPGGDPRRAAIAMLSLEGGRHLADIELDRRAVATAGGQQ